MSKYVLVAGALLCLVVVACAPSKSNTKGEAFMEELNTALDEEGQGVEVGVKDKEGYEYVCKRVRLTGSNIPQTVCQNVRKREVRRERSKDEMRRATLRFGQTIRRPGTRQ